ncbi:MAG: hypothetical protein LBH29_04835 [Elusimicrobiota bacterium]|jgi:hypothetical protein|nr:hypothetical protein [Elusimicrobiota bacterium]
MKRFLLLMFCIGLLIGCGSKSDNPVNPTYILTFQFDPDDGVSQEGYLYAAREYHLKATIKESNGNVVTGDINWRYTIITGNINTPFTGSQWNSGVRSIPSQSDEYFVVWTRSDFSGDYLEFTLKAYSEIKGIECSKTIRIIYQAPE